MSKFEVGLLILLVLGVIASNLAVLKYTAKFKMTQFGQTKPREKTESEKQTVEREDEQKKNNDHKE